MARESSSRNDQLDAPLMARASRQGRLEPAQDGLRAPTEHRLPLPREIVAEHADGVHPGLSGQVAQRGEPAQRPGTEQIALVGGEPALRQHPAAHYPGREPAREQDGARAHYGTSCRATSAWARVTPSTYSRSPPMGSPRASRVTRTSWPARSCWI